MYNVTQDFINQIKQAGRQFKATVTIRSTVFSDDDIVSMGFDENVNPADSFILGSTASSKIEVTLMNIPADLILDGADVAAVIGLFTGSVFEDVPLGTFWVDEISKNKGTIKLICFDNMIKLEKAYFSDLTYPSSINAVAHEICTKAGIELAANLPDIQINKIEGYTCREAIGFIASFLGGFARFDRLGKLEITSYADSGFTIEADNYFPPLIIAEKPFTIGKLTCKVGDSILTSGTNGNEIQFENPIMTQAQLGIIFSTLSTLSYMPYSMDWQGNQALQAGDKITIIDENNNIYSTLLMQNKVSYSGGLKASATAEGKTDSAQEFNSSGSMKNAVDRLVTEQANIKVLLAVTATIEDLIATNGRIDNLSVTYATILNLNAATARIGTLETTTAHITNGIIDNATIDVAKINNLSANYAHLTNGLIDNAQILGADIVDLSANYITAGTLSVERLEIRGSTTSIVYELNNITGALQSQNIDTLNGEILTPRTITADKIIAHSITANEMFIGTITAASGIINDIDASVITTGTLDASKANIINLNASNITAGTMMANRISGGTLKLGGASNGNGIFQVLNASTAEILHIDNMGLSAYSGDITITDVGLRAYGLEGGNQYTIGGTKYSVLSVGANIISSYSNLSNGHAGALESWGTSSGWDFYAYDVSVGSSGHKFAHMGINSILTFDMQFASSVATGTAPMTIASTTKVANLNVDYLDGYSAGNASSNIPISNGTVCANLNAALVGGKSIYGGCPSSTVTATAAYGSEFIGTVTVNFGQTLPSIPTSVVCNLYSSGRLWCQVVSATQTSVTLHVISAIAVSNLAFSCWWVAVCG